MKKEINNYFNSLNKALKEVDRERIVVLANLFIKSYINNKNIFVFGNGGSASTASHLACDINKGVSCGRDKRFRVVCLNDNVPTMMAYANDLSYSEIFIEQLKNFMQKRDLVIGFSGSGNSLNVLKAIDYANKKGAVTFGISGFDGGELAKIAQFHLVVKISDMQKVEDVHLIIVHILMQVLSKRLDELSA